MGVVYFVLKAWKSYFSAPRIWTVETRALFRLVINSSCFLFGRGESE